MDNNDISNLMNMLNNMDQGQLTNGLNQLNNMFNNNNNNEKEESPQNFNQASSLDMETMMKIKSVMETINNKNDPNSNLLYSLKPYLRKSKQVKLDQYANLLKISQVADLFKKQDKPEGE